jgi:hypothetical protein
MALGLSYPTSLAILGGLDRYNISPPSNLGGAIIGSLAGSETIERASCVSPRLMFPPLPDQFKAAWGI